MKKVRVLEQMHPKALYRLVLQTLQLLHQCSHSASVRISLAHAVATRSAEIAQHLGLASRACGHTCMEDSAARDRDGSERRVQ